MNAERVWLRTDAEGHLLEVPSLPPNSRIEAIFLVTDAQKATAVRVPPPELASMTIIHGDLVAPAADPEDWDALR